MMPAPRSIPLYDLDNRLETFNGLNVVHDDDGNMTFGPLMDNGFVTYTYDARNRLVSAGGVTYTYDAEGNRIAFTTTEGTTKLAVDPNAALSRVLVRERPDGTKTFYVYGLTLLYEVDESEAIRTYHFNQVGSTVALVAADGLTVTDRLEYSPYGQILTRTGNTDTPFLYNGVYGVQTDPNGLLSMRARYYNPHLRRFLNADPIGFEGGLNWYAYANGNPLLFLDPTGLDAWTRVLGGMRAVGGGFEVAVGAALVGASATFGVGTSWTGVGAVAGAAGVVGGVAVASHGVDTFQAGVRQMWTGQHVDSVTATTLQSFGMSPEAANLTDAGIGLVGSLGGGIATTGFRVATLSGTASPQVANASLLTKMKYYEAGQTSFPSSLFNTSYGNIPNTLDRGAQILSDSGSLWGVARAGSTTFGIAENTLRFGPTPMANGFLGAAFGSTGTALSKSRR